MFNHINHTNHKLHVKWDVLSYNPKIMDPVCQISRVFLIVDHL